MGTITPAVRGAPEERGFRRLWRALRQLFHEAIGAVFGVLALAWLNAALRAWTRDVAYWLIGLAVVLAGLLGFFSVTQFLRARKVR